MDFFGRTFFYLFPRALLCPLNKFVGTFVAQAFDDVVDALHGEAFGQGHLGNLYLLEAECAVACRAIEVCVQVFHIAIAVVSACCILQGARTVVNGMD